VWGVAWSPDGTTLATASADKTAIIWNTTTGKPQQILKGHTYSVRGVAWSPDGTTLATTSTYVVLHTDRETPDKILTADSDGTACIEIDNDTYRYRTTGNPASAWFANGLCRFELHETEALAALGIHRLPDIMELT
jgi:WD40 repeat protein